MARKAELAMDLLLWRHAEAEPEAADDLDRRLTARGLKQAKSVGSWLLAHRPRQLRIIVSPAMRARQTAASLGLDYEISRQLAPSASVGDLLAAAGWPAAGGAVLLVGHQPTLGQLAGRLLTGAETGLAIGKGALWWFAADGDRTLLKAVMPPALAG